jgi:hypothetical protein
MPSYPSRSRLSRPLACTVGAPAFFHDPAGGAARYFVLDGFARLES